MIYTDYLYIFFVLLLTLVYFVLPLSKRWIALLATSICFYCTWGVKLLPFAAAATAVAWGAGLIITRRFERMDAEIKSREWSDRKEKAAFQLKVKQANRWILWTAVAILLGMLIYTKVGVFLVSDRTKILIPLGISYYTMSLISYLADVYWRKETAENNFFKLFLFAIFFPKILEGPISRHRLVAKQLNEGHTYDYDRMCKGFQRILWGYFKKLVIADRLSMFVTPVFTNYTYHHGSILLVAAIFGALQLYCDFSGAMDMALGTAEIFGISLEENFNHPFFSKSAAEFWRRWHITLGTWFKDYIYMPLIVSPGLMQFSGKVRKRFGKRAGKNVLTIGPLLLVWLLTGLWHGTGANYVAWGVYWGLLIILSTVLEPELKQLNTLLHIDADSNGFNLFRMVRTFCLFVISRIISIPSSLHATMGIFNRILLHFGAWELVDGTLYKQGLSRQNFVLVLLCIFVLYLVSRQQEKGVNIREWIAVKPLPLRWTIYIISIMIVLIFGIYGAGYNASSFVYMKY